MLKCCMYFDYEEDSCREKFCLLFAESLALSTDVLYHIILYSIEMKTSRHSYKIVNYLSHQFK